MTTNKKTKIISFIDRVAPKNKLQIDVMHDLGYSTVFFVNTYLDYSQKYFSSLDRYTLLASGSFKRLKHVFSFFRENRKTIHHVEVYPGGRFSFIYLLIAKLFSIPSICVERGDLLYYKKGGYGLLTRFSMWVCYKRASIVWYRELYMEDMLKSIGVKKLFFIHNAVESKNALQESSNISFPDRSIDFLWVNRLIPERMSDWFVDILNKETFINTKNILAGILKETLYHSQQEYVIAHKPHNLTLLDFVADPSKLYKKAKFFVLPAKVVFANNALLEAMSFGVIPVIVNSSGYELIIENGKNGIVADFSKDAFERAMKQAMALDKDMYLKMSDAARQRIEKSFSVEIYRGKILELYEKIES